MNGKLKELLEKYPKLLDDKSCFVIEFNEGWYSILATLCKLIQDHVDKTDIPQVKVKRIKDRYGSLQFDVDFENEIIHSYIEFAKELSSRVCSCCGKLGKLRKVAKGFIKTLCDECLKEYNK